MIAAIELTTTSFAACTYLFLRRYIEKLRRMHPNMRSYLITIDV